MRPSVRQVVLRGVLRGLQQKIDYVTLGEGVKDALITGAVLSFACPELSGSCVQVFEDNQGGIALAANSLSSARSKRIDVRVCHSFCFCTVSGFTPAGLSLAILRSWLELNVFSVSQCFDQGGCSVGSFQQ